MKKQRRRLIVLGSLVAVLTFTSALLLALAPAPLTPGASGSLFAIDTPQSLDAVFQTDVTAQPGRWNSIYIHQSLTAGGDATSLAQGAQGIGDHFVIGNGDGAVDGEVQLSQRWNGQTAAAAPVATSARSKHARSAAIDPRCISICLVGNLDQTAPTQMQVKRLTQLVWALQSRLGIRARNVIVLGDGASALGIGKRFPAASFRRELLP